GWWVYQDSVFVNGYNAHLRWQTQSEYGPNGSAVFQGITFGRISNIGKATTWVADCEARQSADSGADICTTGGAPIGTNLAELWLINTYSPSNTTFKPVGDSAIGKVVIVNSGCNSGGCNGTIGYGDGWPMPYEGKSGKGPGTCPNGQISSDPAAYCYT